MGAHFHVKINDRITRNELKQFVDGKRLVLADSKSSRQPISYTSMAKKLNPSDHVCLIVGNETKGISDDIYENLIGNGDGVGKQSSGVVVKVPLQKTIESLNCSVAFAVIAFEIKRILMNMN